MNSKRLKKAILFNIAGVFFFVLCYVIFLCVGEWDIKQFLSACIYTIPYLLLCILAYYWNKLFPILPLVLNTSLVLISNIDPNIKITIFFIIPIILSMYYGSKLFLRITLVYNIIVYYFYPLHQAVTQNIPAPEKYILSVIFVIPYAFGILFMYLISRKFMINTEQIRKENEIYTSAGYRITSRTIGTLLTASKKHSKYFNVHNTNVRIYTSLILDEMMKSEQYKDIVTNDFRNAVMDGAAIHDIGKLWIDNSILDKVDPLDEEEFDLIIKHPRLGIDILEELPLGSIPFEEKDIIRNIILQHHERLNGTGYPYKLHGNQISLEAQIVAIADSLDAALSLRSYKLPKEFDSLYMELITKGYDEYNQALVMFLYERKDEIISYAKKSLEEQKLL